MNDPFPVKPKNVEKGKSIYERLKNLTENARVASREMAHDSEKFSDLFRVTGIAMQGLVDETSAMLRDEGEGDE